MLTLADLLEALVGLQYAAWGQVPEAGGWAGARELEISSAVVDSRLATPGSLFAALRGMQRDGHDFIPAAVANGAVVVVAERVPAGASGTVLQVKNRGSWPLPLQPPVWVVVPDVLAALQQAAAHWRRKNPVRVVAVTGSVGKTVSKETIAAVLRRRYRTLRSEGNYNNEIGLPLTLLQLAAGHERAVVEMGMYDLGEIAALAEMALPAVGVVTNVGPSHLERLGSMERIAQAKAELPQALPPAGEGGVAVLNADDERVRAMARLTPARVVTYGLQPGADIWASDVESGGLDGIRFRLHQGRQVVHVRMPMLGRHSVHTALSAAAVGWVEGLDWAEIIAGLGDPSAQLRLVAVPGPKGSTVLDDTYNSSPASCIAALNLLEELGRRKVAVLGDMAELGSYEQEGHRLVGRRARAVADVLVVVGPLGRLIGEEAVDGGMAPDVVRMVASNDEAVEAIRELVQTGDMILVKGSRSIKMDEIVTALTQPRPGIRPQVKEGQA